MIELCREAGLPEPDFELRQGSFVITLWRDWLTPEVLAELALNERQLKAIPLIRQNRLLTNSEYQAIAGATRPTAKRDLEELVKKGVIIPRGSGRGAYYEYVKKRLINGSFGSLDEESGNGS